MNPGKYSLFWQEVKNLNCDLCRLPESPEHVVESGIYHGAFVNLLAGVYDSLREVLNASPDEVRRVLEEIRDSWTGRSSKWEVHLEPYSSGEVKTALYLNTAGPYAFKVYSGILQGKKFSPAILSLQGDSVLIYEKAMHDIETGLIYENFRTVAKKALEENDVFLIDEVVFTKALAKLLNRYVQPLSVSEELVIQELDGITHLVLEVRLPDNSLFLPGTEMPSEKFRHLDAVTVAEEVVYSILDTFRERMFTEPDYKINLEIGAAILNSIEVDKAFEIMKEVQNELEEDNSPSL